MNDWAKTSEIAPRLSCEFDRRVYRREFAAVLGYGLTWFRALEKRGLIPSGRRDRGGKRLWWTTSQVRQTLAELSRSSQQPHDPAQRMRQRRHSSATSLPAGTEKQP